MYCFTFSHSMSMCPHIWLSINIYLPSATFQSVPALMLQRQISPVLLHSVSEVVHLIQISILFGGATGTAQVLY